MRRKYCYSDVSFFVRLFPRFKNSSAISDDSECTALPIHLLNGISKY